MRQKGFTLVELLVVVSLIIIVVGVTGDIVVSLVRSYNKTQITTEVEQNATFVMTKLERELRNAYEVTDIQPDSLTFKREKTASAEVETITYSIEQASDGTNYIGRAVDGGAILAVTNHFAPAGVNVDPVATMFHDVSPTTGPKVIKVELVMRQIGNPVVQFTQSTRLENTIIVRGSY